MNPRAEQLSSALAGQYRIEREVGTGGMATVYAADDLKHRRRVAIKVLRDELALSVVAARFLREIEIAARLQHPHILGLIDSGDAGGVLYYVMPYVEGESLRQRLDREQELPVGDAVRLLIEIVDALAYAHAHGIVHRDIKPDNVMMSGRHALVMDFGVARAVTEAAEEQRVTQTGVALGTPAYMAPEQAMGESSVDHRADIYALGVLAYELLSGQPPFTGRTAQQLVAAHITETPESVARRRPTIPPALDVAVMKCLAKRPADRWQSANELLAALERVAISGDGTATAMPARTGVTANTTWRRRNLVGGTIVLMVAAAWLALAARWRSEPRVPDHEIKSLAVMPLSNRANDVTQEYFVDGMYDALIAELTQIQHLRVVSRTSAERYKLGGSSFQTMARDLKVDAVVQGAVSRVGKRVSIEVELRHLRPERVLWAHTYEREESDVLALHRDIARAIADEIQLAFSPPSSAGHLAPRSVEPAAYDAWLRGAYHAARRSGADIDACIRYAKQSVAADPSYAPAFELLAQCYNFAPFVSAIVPKESFEEAKRAARHALQLDETFAPAHATLAYTLAHNDWDWAAAERSYRTALQLNPSLDRAEGDLGWLLSWLGRFDEALQHAQRAEALNPMSPQAVLRVGMILHLAGRHHEALEKAQHAIALDSAFMYAFSRLHWALYGERRHGEALIAAKRAAALSGDKDLRQRAFLGHAYALTGNRRAAQEILNELLEIQRGSYVPPTAIATVYVGLGDTKQAIRWLERGYLGRDPDMVLLKTFAVWDPLRSDPRFAALIEQMRYPSQPR